MTRQPLVLAAVLSVAVAGSGLGQVGAGRGLINPNLASVQELVAVPHVDAAKAEAIVAGRPYLSMATVHELAGVGLSREQLDEAYAALWLPINLNTASAEVIALIPGVGRRMTHEFEEYRPYLAMEQFRREIGKYVDDEELARLEQYTFVPLDLNTASDEEFLTIPGVGKRMVHEFVEYRPYKSIEQFRREIGKYVDDNEVTRLERYLTIGDQ